MIENVIFDLDGTLLESGPGIKNAIRYAAEKENLPLLPDAELETAIGPPLDQSLVRLYGVSHEKALEMGVWFREYYLPTGQFEGDFYPGILDLLAELRAAGKGVYLCTAKPLPFVRDIFARHNLHRLFLGLAGPEMTMEPYNKNEGLARLIEKHGIKNAVMVGDRKYDIEAGRHCQLPTVGVLWGYGSASELTLADFLAETTDDLRWYLFTPNCGGK